MSALAPYLPSRLRWLEHRLRAFREELVSTAIRLRETAYAEFDSGFARPDLLAKRHLVFAACMNTATSYRALQATRVRWPLAHPFTANIGGVISARTGLAIAYYGHTCGCISQARRPVFPMEFYDEAGAAFHQTGRLLRVPSQDSADTLHHSCAALTRIENYRRPPQFGDPVIRRTLPSPGDALYAYGLVQGQWCLSAGRCIGVTDDGRGVRQIVTSLQVYHGFCGAMLFDAWGRWVGFGACIAGTDTEATRRLGRWTRIYGIGLFEPLSDVLPELLGTEHAREVAWS